VSEETAHKAEIRLEEFPRGRARSSAGTLAGLAEAAEAPAAGGKRARLGAIRAWFHSGRSANVAACIAHAFRRRLRRRALRARGGVRGIARAAASTITAEWVVFLRDQPALALAAFIVWWTWPKRA